MKNKENLKVSLQRDLKYEIDMLNKSYNDILREFPLMLEVFLIHARLLNNFFYHKTSKYNDEVLAKDFIEKWNRKEPYKIKKINERINKYLAHLSIERVTRKYKDWSKEVIYLHKNLNKTHSNFLKKVPRKYLV